MRRTVMTGGRKTHVGFAKISGGKNGYSRRFESNYAGDTQWTHMQISKYD